MVESRAIDWKRGAAVLAMLLPLVLSACADPNDRETQLDWGAGWHGESESHPAATYYTVHVRPGDTLAMLAGRYDVPVDSVARLNGIGRNYPIRTGETLRIPAGARATHDAVYADALSTPSRSNPYIPAPAPRRGGYPQTSGGVATAALPPLKGSAVSSGPITPVGGYGEYDTAPRVTASNAPVVTHATAPGTPAVAQAPASSTAKHRTPSPGDTVVAGNTRPHGAPAWYTPWAAQSQPEPEPQPAAQPVAPPQPVVQQQRVPGSGRFVWPVTGRVIAQFGSSANGERNDGINIAAKAGDPIRAAASGTVTYAGNQLRSYGNLLLIRHDDGYVTAYAHAQSILVQKGDRVLKGQVIGSVGQTGDVTEPQLHFEIRNGVQPVNPMALLVASR